MPTVLIVRGFHFSFYSVDRSEPPHVHIYSAGRRAKYWLNPVQIVKNRGFKEPELLRLVSIVREHQELLLEAWREFFNEQDIRPGSQPNP